MSVSISARVSNELIKTLLFYMEHYFLYYTFVTACFANFLLLIILIPLHMLTAYWKVWLKTWLANCISVSLCLISQTSQSFNISSNCSSYSQCCVRHRNSAKNSDQNSPYLLYLDLNLNFSAVLLGFFLWCLYYQMVWKGNVFQKLINPCGNTKYIAVDCRLVVGFIFAPSLYFICFKI